MSPFRKLARFFGRRGGILFLFGLAWTVLGLGFILINTNRFSNPTDPPVGSVLVALDDELVGLLWLVGGLIALVNSLVRRRFGNEDAIGYAALTVPAMAWMSFYTLSYTSYLVSDGEYGRQGALIAIPVYAIISTVLVMISGWPDPSDVHPQASSAELALLDQFDESHDANAARGQAAREAHELWVQEGRRISEAAIQRSARENDRRLSSEEG